MNPLYELTLQMGKVIEQVSIGEKKYNSGCQGLEGGKNRELFNGY